jgi:hypothetical protein
MYVTGTGNSSTSAVFTLINTSPPPKCCYKIVFNWTCDYPLYDPGMGSLTVIWGVAPGAVAYTGDCIGSASNSLPSNIGPSPGGTGGIATYHTCNAVNVKFSLLNILMYGGMVSFHATWSIVLEDEGGCP